MTELRLQARELLRRYPLIDGHNDLPWALRERAGGDVSKVRLLPPGARPGGRGQDDPGPGDPGPVDLAAPVGGTHTDLPRLAAGGHVGLGGDFDGTLDGTLDVAVGLEDVSRYPALFAELLNRGWTESGCAALAGGNLLRVMRAAESHAVTAAT